MTCPRCKAENREGARFCRECGAMFASVCPSCGTKAEVGRKFCDSCGAPLVARPVPEATPSRFASPESYTPKHLAEKILAPKSALEGEGKQREGLSPVIISSVRDRIKARCVLSPLIGLFLRGL